MRIAYNILLQVYAMLMVLYILLIVVLYAILLIHNIYENIKLLRNKTIYVLKLSILNFKHFFLFSVTTILIYFILNFAELNEFNNYYKIFISIIVSYILYMCINNVFYYKKEEYKKSLKEELGNLWVIFFYIMLVSIIRIIFLLSLNINNMISFVLTIVCIQAIATYIFSILKQRSLLNKNYSIFNFYMCNTIKFSWLITTIILSCFIYKFNPIYNILIYLQGLELLFPIYGSISYIKYFYKDFINYYIGNYNGTNQLNRRSNFWKFKFYKDNNKIIYYNNWNPVSKFQPLPTFIKDVNKNILFNTVVIDVKNITNINPKILLSIIDKCNGIKLNYINYINNKLCVNINYVNSCYNVTIKNVVLDIKDYINYPVDNKSSLDLTKVKLCKDIDGDIKDFEKMLNKKSNDKLVKNIIENTNKNLVIFPLANADPFIEKLIWQIDDIKNRYANRLDLKFINELFELFKNNPSLMTNNVNPNDFLLFSNNKDIFEGFYCKIFLDTSVSYYLPYNPHTFHDEPIVLFKKQVYEGCVGGVYIPESIAVANPLLQVTKFCTADGEPFTFNSDVVRFKELVRSRVINSNAYYNCNGELIILPWKLHSHSYVNNELDPKYKGEAGVRFIKYVEENYNKNITWLNDNINQNTKFYSQALNLMNKFPTWMFDEATLNALYNILTNNSDIENYKRLKIYGFAINNLKTIAYSRLGNSNIQIITNNLQTSYDTRIFDRFFPTDWSFEKFTNSIVNNVENTPDFNLLPALLDFYNI